MNRGVSLPEFYLDIETLTKGNKPDPKTDEIITIQFQRLNTKTGKQEGSLTILKAWERNEMTILKRFYEIFQPNDEWNFIPMGQNLSYDLCLLHYRWKSINKDIPLTVLFHDHPRIDLKSLFVIMNLGSFKGAGLDTTGKKETGIRVIEWYRTKEYDKIENYIRNKATEFINLYQKLKKILPIIDYNKFEL